MENGKEYVKLVCRGCDNIEDVPLQIVVGGAEISCSSCGSFIVETKCSSYISKEM